MKIIDLAKIKAQLIKKHKKTGCLSVSSKLPDGTELIYFSVTGNFRAMSSSGTYSDALDMSKKLMF